MIGLASREIAAGLVSGVFLAAQRPFKLGDTIRYEDGQGEVVRMGLINTFVKGPDEVTIKIPNSDLNYKTFANLSRVDKSQVYQKLRFTYDALDQMPELISEIKSGIIKSCPTLVNNVSSPFYVHFNSFEERYLEVIVDVRFKVKADSNEHHQVKEDVLTAIGKAARTCNAQFYVG